MRTVDNHGKDLVVGAAWNAPLPAKIIPSAHQPVTYEVNQLTVQLAAAINNATRLAHRILRVAQGVAANQVAVFETEVERGEWAERGVDLRILADDLVTEAMDVSPQLRQAADICALLEKMTGEGIVPGEAS